jgi:flagellar protein FlaJ
MFLEFSRNLAESVNTGTPISKSIVNMRKKNYGSLSIYIEKLANQIELGIPVNKALRNFATDVNSEVISRAVALIMEAERAGGDIDYILESVAKSISEVEKLKKERKAAIYNLVVQGYIIFFIFIGIMLVMQFKILPLTNGIGSIGALSGNVNALQGTAAKAVSSALSPENLSRQFLYLLLAQGFFAGLTIGKLAEGSLKAGVKHSFVLVTAAFLIATGANAYKALAG